MSLIPYEFSADRFSRWMAYVLRHNPARYGLSADRHGFVGVEEFLQIARRRYPQASEETLRHLISQGGEGRFEIAAGRLRARYGHSIFVEPSGRPIEPPAVLYYGIDAGRLSAALAEGLRPLDRQWLHLSDHAPDAWAMIRRRAGQPCVLRIDAAAAHASGIRFYQEQKVHLASFVPAPFLQVEPQPAST